MFKNFIILLIFIVCFSFQAVIAADVDSPAQIANQLTMIGSIADQITQMTQVITSLNEQLDNLKEQLDLQKQINAGADVIDGLKDVKTLYGSVLDLQGAFTDTLENVNDIQAQVESYFGPIEIEEAKWGDRYQGIQVGRQSAYLSLVSSLELKQKTKDAEESIWSLMEKNIDGLNPEGMNKYIAEALKNLLTLQLFQAKAQAQQGEAEATEKLNENNDKISGKEGDKVVDDALYNYAASISSIGFDTPHNFGEKKK